jgi:hypothetical protein
LKERKRFFPTQLATRNLTLSATVCPKLHKKKQKDITITAKRIDQPHTQHIPTKVLPLSEENGWTTNWQHIIIHDEEQEEKDGIDCCY